MYVLHVYTEIIENGFVRHDVILFLTILVVIRVESIILVYDSNVFCRISGNYYVRNLITFDFSNLTKALGSQRCNANKNDVAIISDY